MDSQKSIAASSIFSLVTVCILPTPRPSEHFEPPHIHLEMDLRLAELGDLRSPLSVSGSQYPGVQSVTESTGPAYDSLSRAPYSDPKAACHVRLDHSWLVSNKGFPKAATRARRWEKYKLWRQPKTIPRS